MGADHQIHRMIAAYDKRTESHVADIAVTGLDTANLRALLQLGHADPVMDCYPITDDLAAYLLTSRHIEDALDLDRFDYVLEAHRLPQDK